MINDKTPLIKICLAFYFLNLSLNRGLGNTWF